VGELRAIAVAAVVVYGLVVGASSVGASSASFANCTAMHKVYKYRHGIGRVGAHDHTTGVPVTTFYRSNRLYYLNRGLDRDKDGIACEKR
jgi:hypothetical protein